MAQHISTTEMTHEQWLDARKDSIGSSDVGAILGLSRYDTPRDVYNKKKGLVPEFEGNKHTRWGLLFEPTIAQAFIEDELPTMPGCRVQQDNKIRRHAGQSWATCNLDRLIIGTGEPTILELKSTTSFAQKGWDAVVPTVYYAQVQWQMFVTGYKKAIIWVAIMDTKTFLRLDVERSDEFITRMLDEVARFKAALDAGDPSTLALEYKDVERLRPIEGSKIEATPELLSTLSKLTQLKAQKGEIEKSEKALSTELKTFIGENENLVEGDRVLATYKLQHKDAYTVAASDYRVLNLQREKKERVKK